MQLTAAIIHELKEWNRWFLVVIKWGNFFIKAISFIKAQAEVDELWLTDLNKYGSGRRLLIGFLSWIQKVGPEEVFLTYQLVVSVRAKLDCHGYGELVFKSGEGAWEIATTSKDGSRRENYPLLIQRDSDKK
jgi:hypothetical protein